MASTLAPDGNTSSPLDDREHGYKFTGVSQMVARPVNTQPVSHHPRTPSNSNTGFDAKIQSFLQNISESGSPTLTRSSLKNGATALAQNNHSFLAECDKFNASIPLEHAGILRQREDMLAALRRNRDYFGKYFRYIKDELKGDEFALRLLNDLNSEYDRLYSVCTDAGDSLDHIYRDYKAAMEQLAIATRIVGSKEVRPADLESREEQILRLAKERDDWISKHALLTTANTTLEVEKAIFREKLLEEESNGKALVKINLQLNDTIGSLEGKLEQLRVDCQVPPQYQEDCETIIRVLDLLQTENPMLRSENDKLREKIAALEAGVKSNGSGNEASIKQPDTLEKTKAPKYTRKPSVGGDDQLQFVNAQLKHQLAHEVEAQKNTRNYSRQLEEQIGTLNEVAVQWEVVAKDSFRGWANAILGCKTKISSFQKPPSVHNLIDMEPEHTQEPAPVSPSSKQLKTSMTSGLSLLKLKELMPDVENKSRELLNQIETLRYHSCQTATAPPIAQYPQADEQFPSDGSTQHASESDMDRLRSEYARLQRNYNLQKNQLGVLAAQHKRVEFRDPQMVGIVSQILEAGVHKSSPRRGYVQEAYYRKQTGKRTT